MLDTATFDEGMTNALLAMAAQEQLIEPGPNESDGVFNSMAARPVPDWMKRQVLEQIVLTPRILTQREFSSGFLAGQLLEEGNLQHISPMSTALFRIGGFSKSIIGGMLRARGYDIPVDDFQPRLDRCRTALNEQEVSEATLKREFPSPIGMAMYRFLRRGRPPLPDDFTEEELLAQEARQRRYQDASPLLDCMTEYLNLAVIAQAQSALLTTPIEATLDTILTPPPVPTEGEAPEIALVRIVARDLGKLSFRPTLRESLVLARDPATIALRERLPVWLNELSVGNIRRAELVQREIKQATRALQRAAVGSAASNLTTWAGIPLLALDSLIGLPSGVGIAVTLIGTGGLAAAEGIKHQYRWATFGNT